jgi:energy-coupling factor transport system ATP-binding protein
MLEFKDIFFAYEGEKWIVRNLSFSIAQGEFVALLGKNGSGKSTIARLANGLLTSQKGKIYVDGLDTSNPSDTFEVRKSVGIVFQNPDNQFIGMTVEEDIAFGLENINLPKEEAFERITEISEMLQISTYLSFPLNLLSGGEKQKIAIASVLVLRPKYLIFDEITSLLDPINRENIFFTVRKICKDNNIGVLYITHNPEEAVYSDRIEVLFDGTIAREGKPDEILLEVEFLNELGISSPQIAIISNELNKVGIISKATLNLEDLVQKLC